MTRLTHMETQDIEPGDIVDLVDAARDLLRKIDNMTTEQFGLGAEKEERERLRRVLRRVGEYGDIKGDLDDYA